MGFNISICDEMYYLCELSYSFETKSRNAHINAYLPMMEANNAKRERQAVHLSLLAFVVQVKPCEIPCTPAKKHIIPV